MKWIFFTRSREMAHLLYLTSVYPFVPSETWMVNLSVPLGSNLAKSRSWPHIILGKVIVIIGWNDSVILQLLQKLRNFTLSKPYFKWMVIDEWIFFCFNMLFWNTSNNELFSFMPYLLSQKQKEKKIQPRSLLFHPAVTTVTALLFSSGITAPCS